MENNVNEQELDLLELLQIMLNRWYLIFASVIVVFSLTTIYAVVMLEDTYTTHSSVLVSVTAEGQAVDSGDVLLAQRLLDTYTEVAESNRVLHQLRDDLDLTYSTGTLRNMVSVSRGRDNAIVIRFNVTSTDPNEAALMADGIVSIIQSIADDSSILHDIEVLDTAETPTSPSGPNRLLYMAIGLVLGGMIGVFGVFLIEFLDKSIKTSKDLENKLGLRVLGLIPEYKLEDDWEEV